MTFRIFIVTIFIGFFTSCNSQKESKKGEHKFTNDLIDETSPYLLQHAHNPVNWNAWNDKTLTKAKENKKLMLISVGYSACHWCHVMEHESFEDSTVAAVMNKNFINIKIDREERPDIDKVYMSAVQLMTGRGGWPMNVIALPDGRPVFGGTYFPKDNWVSMLQQIQKMYEENPARLEEYASQLTQGIKSMSLIEPNLNVVQFKKQDIAEAVKKWSVNFDHEKGGMDHAPKFMMPNNYHFLLRYAHQTKDEHLMDYVINTLNQISYGGVYDHVGGGFSRYSTDDKWHVPHFEKMLYDNGQLVSLYSDAYLLTKDDWYKQVVYETLSFVSKELTSEEGAFYSSLDADSLNKQDELEEGAFYVWKKIELETALGKDFDLFSEYYNINSYGLWEQDNYVLIRKTSDKDFIKKHAINERDFKKKQKEWKKTLYNLLAARTRPRLDDKVLTSWNALMLKGCVDAYRIFQDPSFLKMAQKNAQFIVDKQLRSNGQLWHSYKNGKSTINAYLQDYATVIESFIGMYQITMNQNWLNKAKLMTNYVDANFYDEVSGLYFFTSVKDTALLVRNIESTDNVIPASNSILAKCLYQLSHYFADESYLKRAQKMLHHTQPKFIDYPSGYSNWMDLMLNFTHNYYEVVIVGPEAKEKLTGLQQHYIPNKLIVASTESSEEPLLKNRFNNEETYIYICVNNTCKYPVKRVVKAVELLKGLN